MNLDSLMKLPYILRVVILFFVISCVVVSVPLALFGGGWLLLQLGEWIVSLGVSEEAAGVVVGILCASFLGAIILGSDEL